MAKLREDAARRLSRHWLPVLVFWLFIAAAAADFCVTISPMFEDYDRGEKMQKAGMFKARLIIFGVIIVCSLIAVGVSKWSASSLHDKLAKRHEQTNAVFRNVFKNGNGSNAVYAITYAFAVNGKTYENVGYSNINPRYPRGVVFYNPDNPEESELQPIPKEEANPNDDH